MSIYIVCAATEVGHPVAMAAVHATVDKALGEAEAALTGGAAFAWIVDGDGNLILPPDQVNARLDRLPRASPGFAH
jgi:hypothetical protein